MVTVLTVSFFRCVKSSSVPTVHRVLNLGLDTLPSEIREWVVKLGSLVSVENRGYVSDPFRFPLGLRVVSAPRGRTLSTSLKCTGQGQKSGVSLRRKLQRGWGE